MYLKLIEPTLMTVDDYSGIFPGSIFLVPSLLTFWGFFLPHWMQMIIFFRQHILQQWRRKFHLHSIDIFASPWSSSTNVWVIRLPHRVRTLSWAASRYIWQISYGKLLKVKCFTTFNRVSCSAKDLFFLSDTFTLIMFGDNNPFSRCIPMYWPCHHEILSTWEPSTEKN